MVPPDLPRSSCSSPISPLLPSHPSFALLTLPCSSVLTPPPSPLSFPPPPPSPAQIYLNDSFTAGHTTFFLPSPTREGLLDAHRVKPLAGCALVFPHGDTHGSLLHEGSPVGEGGAKYVIRTDVLYEVKPRRGGVEEESEV